MTNSIVPLLQNCRSTIQVLQVHAQLVTTNLISDPFLASQFLTCITSKASNLAYAQLVFSRIDRPNTFIWNTMIKGHLKSSNPEKALHYFVEMRRNELLGDSYTYPFVLKACGMICAVWEGREVHGQVLKCGFEWDVFVRNGLIDFYCKRGEMSRAKELFDGFFGKDLVSWNLILGGFVERGQMDEAQKLFDEMPDRDIISWSIMIDGYGKKIGDVVQARELFDSMPSKDLVSWNSMIGVYAKVGDMVAARTLFDKMVEKNIVSWSTVIDGYAQHGNPKEALNLFRQMLCHSVKPDKMSMVGVLSACAQLGALDEGRWIHMYMKKNNVEIDVVGQTALVDMYMKCGSSHDACKMFNSMLERTVITWNVMIDGLGVNGLEKAALKCYIQMEVTGVPMDDLIFLSTLTACSHAGFVTEGLHVFHQMRVHGIEPKLEHYGCLIDLLGRAGLLDQAQIIIESMSEKPNPSLWGSLLLACRTHQNVALAEVVVQRLEEMKSADCGVYVLMSNIYADAGRWERVSRTRNLMREQSLKKETGKSVIEIDGCVEEFIGGKKGCVQSEDIEKILLSLREAVIMEEWALRSVSKSI